LAPLRHLTSINDLSNDEVEKVFALAERYLKTLGDGPRIVRGMKEGRSFVLATLFHEPSTRTRLSFESATLRLGGRVISSADPAASSAKKGESLADEVRMVSNYADAIVIRHHRDGAARFAAEYAQVPIINGGDGAHEHPTQTIGDLFTLKREKGKLTGLNVALVGDLATSRTVHSLVYALARFGANIVPMPAPGMALPAHVDRRLRGEFGCAVKTSRGRTGEMYYVAASDAARDQKVEARIDAVYVTRFQAERWKGGAKNYPRVDPKFLRDRRYGRAAVLHPLPRVDELAIAVDNDRRSAYFRQAAYMVPVRMALAALLLGLDGDGWQRFPSGFRKSPHKILERPANAAARCTNKKCIVHDPAERLHARNKFHVMAPRRLRCFYCETDIEAGPKRKNG
jgi:aspartate carbamoyltransferase catalytic subunit